MSSGDARGGGAADKRWTTRLLRLGPAGYLSALCILLPLLIYFVLLPLALDGLVADWRTVSTVELTPAPAAERVADFQTRMQYGLGAALVILLALVAIVHTGLAFWRRRGPAVTAAAMLVTALAGAVTYFSDEQTERDLKASSSAVAQLIDEVLNCRSRPVWSTMRGLAVAGQTRVDIAIARNACDNETIGEKMRALAIDRVLNRVREAETPPDEATVTAIMELAAVTAGFGIAGLWALVLRFADIAWRDRPRGRRGDPARSLRARWRGFRATLMLAALVLTVSVVANRAFYDWPLTLLSPDSAAAYGPTSAAAAGFWGTLYTLVLLAVAVPAALSLYHDISRAADAAGDDPDARADWLKRNALTLKLPEGVGGAVAAAAPLFASPLIDALRGGFAIVP